MKKNLILTLMGLALAFTMNAQSLERMQWFNEPESYTIKGGTLEMDVPGQTDYWRIAHYGFTVDDGPFLYATYGGEFEAKIKVSGDYKVRFDQAGMMIRQDHENYVKFGIEFVDGKFNISTVVTHHTSDWSVIKLEKPVLTLNDLNDAIEIEGGDNISVTVEGQKIKISYDEKKPEEGEKEEEDRKNPCDHDSSGNVGGVNPDDEPDPSGGVTSVVGVGDGGVPAGGEPHVGGDDCNCE